VGENVVVKSQCLSAVGLKDSSRVRLVVVSMKVLMSRYLVRSAVRLESALVGCRLSSRICSSCVGSLALYAWTMRFWQCSRSLGVISIRRYLSATSFSRVMISAQVGLGRMKLRVSCGLEMPSSVARSVEMGLYCSVSHSVCVMGSPSVRVG